MANQRIGLSHAVNPWPDVNQTIISLSRYHRDSVSKHGEKQRNRQKNVEIKQGVEAEKRENALGSDGSAGGARQQTQYEVGEQNAEQDEKQSDGRGRQFSHQAASEDHDDGNILTFSG